MGAVPQQTRAALYHHLDFRDATEKEVGRPELVQFAGTFPVTPFEPSR